MNNLKKKYKFKSKKKYKGGSNQINLNQKINNKNINSDLFNDENIADEINKFNINIENAKDIINEQMEIIKRDLIINIYNNNSNNEKQQNNDAEKVVEQSIKRMGLYLLKIGKLKYNNSEHPEKYNDYVKESLEIISNIIMNHISNINNKDGKPLIDTLSNFNDIFANSLHIAFTEYLTDIRIEKNNINKENKSNTINISSQDKVLLNNELENNEMLLMVNNIQSRLETQIKHCEKIDYEIIRKLIEISILCKFLKMILSLITVDGHIPITTKGLYDLIMQIIISLNKSEVNGHIISDAELIKLKEQQEKVLKSISLYKEIFETDNLVGLGDNELADTTRIKIKDSFNSFNFSNELDSILNNIKLS